METFTITIAETVELEVQYRILEDVAYYDVYANGKRQVSVYPVISDARGIAWLSDDNIDNSLLYLIGRQIESYEA